ncbi:hypothetical protein F5Y06DRAFT_271352 [Hypoxylon sp. FL0890]|nr:hypothetical protein F5Y06DRAFT_271352 [Hypoxylon sp. FL0890]
MTRERKKAPAPLRGVRALTRRAKLERAQQQHHDETWRSLNPLKEPPKMKHKTTFELVENTDKKKKLEFKITTDRSPPPGFEFVPIGHPQLSHLCKEMSREQDAMIFIVSDRQNPDNLEHHMNRVGYHFRQMIVDQARAKLGTIGKSVHIPHTYRPGVPEPIPQDQEEINAQADAVLRDLFPRIPHTDRREIIEHAFRKDGKFHGESRVGMVQELTLARRVQLAAIAHIRHTHTRYDELLKQTSWANARKAVEKPCLDIIVKWRGDEETGRDQLDEILREVIEISDTEEESEDESPGAELEPAQRVSGIPARVSSRYTAGPMESRGVEQPSPLRAQRRGPSVPGTPTMSKQKAITRAEKRSARKTQRFRRYAAAAEALAGSAGQGGHVDDSNVAPLGTVQMDLTTSPGSVRIIGSSREPTVAARGTPFIEQMPRHYELRTDSPHTISGPRRERIPTIPHAFTEANGHTSPQVAYNPESHEPKVGPVPTSYNHPRGPFSPVRHGLQDMLLQSIEPASPITPRGLQEASHTLYRDPQRFIEAPRIVPQAMHEPPNSVSRPWSPRVVSEGNGWVTARHHGADYPGNFDTYSGSSFTQINRQDRGEDLRRVPVEYLADRSVPSFRTTSGLLPRNEPRPAPSEGIAHYSGDVLHRTRANPFIVDDDTISRPHQVVEVRRHPDGDYPVSFRREEVFPHHSVRRDPRMQDGSQVVYIDAPPTRPRSAFDYRVPLNPPSHGVSPYQEPDVHRIPASGLRRHLDPVADYEPLHYREPLHNQHLVLQPGEPRPSVFREARVAPPGLDRHGVHYANTHQHFQERSNFAPIPNPHQERREVRYYRVDEAGQTALPPMEYRHGHPPPHMPPPPDGHYIEGHGTPLQHHAPEHRMVYVDH